MKENDKAPEFTLQNISLKSFRGKWVVLYFYPRDDTPGCTLEAVDFSSLLEEFSKLHATVIGISKDSKKSHEKFITKHNLKVTLLSDEDHVVQELYGIWRLKKFMGREFMGTVRSTFLINPEGIIKKIWDPVRAKGHAQEVLDTLTQLS